MLTRETIKKIEEIFKYLDSKEKNRWKRVTNTPCYITFNDDKGYGIIINKDLIEKNKGWEKPIDEFYKKPSKLPSLLGNG